MVMVLDTQIRFYENLVKITHAGLQNKVFFQKVKVKVMVKVKVKVKV